jgi:hypothetical protein
MPQAMPTTHLQLLRHQRSGTIDLRAIINGQQLAVLTIPA